MRVQFTITDDEYEKIKENVEKYPDLASYCKDKALGERTYKNAWKEVKEAIAKRTREEGPFILSDLIELPPANMGVKLYKNREALGIEYLKQNRTNTAMYVKKEEEENQESEEMNEDDILEMMFPNANSEEELEYELDCYQKD